MHLFILELSPFPDPLCMNGIAGSWVTLFLILRNLYTIFHGGHEQFTLCRTSETIKFSTPKRATHPKHPPSRLSFRDWKSQDEKIPSFTWQTILIIISLTCGRFTPYWFKFPSTPFSKTCPPSPQVLGFSNRLPGSTFLGHASAEGPPTAPVPIWPCPQPKSPGYSAYRSI